MKALVLIDLMRSFVRGDTIQLNMYDGQRYIVNHKQYTMKEFTRIVVCIKNYIVLYKNV